MLDKFAEELHEAREKSGISLQQMAVKTRVDIKFLEAIDKGDFSFLPEPYVIAFIKDFARIVGLDVQKTVQKFEAARKGEEMKVESDSVNGQIDKKPIRTIQTYDATPSMPKKGTSSTINRNVILNGLFIGVIILFVFVIYLIFIKDSSEIIVAEKPIEEIIKDNQDRFVEEEQATQDVTDNLQSSDSISLTVLSGDTSWVKIILDDKRVEEFILFPNSQKTIKAMNNYKMTLGNSGVIKLQMDNKPLSFNGRPGSVVHVQINRSGLTYLKQLPTLENNE